MQCIYCGSHETRYALSVAINGGKHLFEECLSCGKNARGAGKWIGGKERSGLNLDAIPIVNDYSNLAAPCIVCGDIDHNELHHFAPRHIFGDECEKWPVFSLCKKHHDEWHKRMGEHRQNECKYCEGLAHGIND